MLSFRTTNYSGFAAKYSPFYDNKIAVATLANYGLAGNGRLFILQILPLGQIAPETHFDTQDGLFDTAWSEIHENQVAVSLGDGTVKLYDTKVGKYPIAAWAEHQREVFCVNWGNADKHLFVTSSWDGTVKVWNPQARQSIVTLSATRGAFAERVELTAGLTSKPSAVPMSRSQKPDLNISNGQCVYQAKFSPHDPLMVALVSAALRLQLWDIRAPRPLTMDIICHSGQEALSVDFNKYRPTVLATSGVDKTIRIWDMRMINTKFPGLFHGLSLSPQNELMTPHFPVRNVVWSPHSRSELLSCGYDMSARVWDDISDVQGVLGRRVGTNGCLNVFNKHREFVIGGDWSLWGSPGWVVTTGWDEMVYVWNTKKRY